MFVVFVVVVVMLVVCVVSGGLSGILLLDSFFSRSTTSRIPLSLSQNHPPQHISLVSLIFDCPFLFNIDQSLKMTSCGIVKPREIRRHDIKLLDMLGTGNWGAVHKVRHICATASFCDADGICIHISLYIRV